MCRALPRCCSRAYLYVVDATYKSELKETNDLNWERFKEHMDSRFNALRAELMKWMFLYWSGTVAAIIGMQYFGPK